MIPPDQKTFKFRNMIKLTKIEQRKYHKINTLYNRSESDYKLEIGKFCRPEFELLKDIVWIGKEKIDGTNTCILYNCRTKEFDFHGRNVDYIENKELEPPFICLVASGGHTHLVKVEDYGKYEIIGRTRDDAAGEAFDKVARAIGLGYPGGPKIEKKALEKKKKKLE